MQFRELEDPVYSSDLYYDLFDGGYLKPEDLLEEEGDIQAVYAAMAIIKEFIDEAIEADVLTVD